MTGLISHRPFNAYTVVVNSCAHSLFVSKKHFHCNHLLLTAETFPKPIILCVCVYPIGILFLTVTLGMITTGSHWLGQQQDIQKEFRWGFSDDDVPETLKPTSEHFAGELGEQIVYCLTATRMDVVLKRKKNSKVVWFACYCCLFALFLINILGSHVAEVRGPIWRKWEGSRIGVHDMKLPNSKWINKELQ